MHRHAKRFKDVVHVGKPSIIWCFLFLAFKSPSNYLSLRLPSQFVLPSTFLTYAKIGLWGDMNDLGHCEMEFEDHSTVYEYIKIHM